MSVFGLCLMELISKVRIITLEYDKYYARVKETHIMCLWMNIEWHMTFEIIM